MQYTCTTSAVSSITWQFYCPDRMLDNRATLTASVENNVTINEMLQCISDGVTASTVTVAYRITFKSSLNKSRSNISITILETNYSISTTSLTIDCENSEAYRYLDFQGQHHGKILIPWTMNTKRDEGISLLLISLLLYNVVFF